MHGEERKLMGFCARGGELAQTGDKLTILRST